MALSRTDRLTVAVIAFAIIIVIGMITVNRPKYSYEKNGTEALASVLESEYLMPIDEAKTLLDKEHSNVQFVDLRNKSEFNLGHIEGAINIHTANLLNEENLEMFEDAAVTYVFYGNTENEANGPWMILDQLGYENIKMLYGGYDYFKAPDAETPGSSSNFYSEIAQYDYAAIMKKEVDKQAESLKAPTVVSVPKPKVRKPKVIIPQKKVVEEEEEEEGC